MTDRPVLGGVLALLVESAHWLRIRWEFDEKGSARAWQLSVAAIAISGALIYVDGPAHLALLRLLTWLPVLLLPVQFIQAFGMKSSLPLNMFSFLAKQRRQRNSRLGLTESEFQFNFGNVYFITCLVGSAVGNAANTTAAWLYLPGSAVLVGWVLLASRNCRLPSLLCALAMAVIICMAGQLGLEKLNDRFTFNRGQFSGFDPNSTYTRIGKPGPVEQSANIVWRARAVSGKIPTLLRLGCYNNYRENGNWFCAPFFDPQFTDLDTRPGNFAPSYILTRDSTHAEQVAAVSPELPRFTLRGAAAEYAPLPLPGNTASLQGFDLDSADRNFFGTVRVFPKRSVITGEVVVQADSFTEDPAVLPLDLQIPYLERRTLKAILKELHLLKPTLLETYLRQDNLSYQHGFTPLTTRLPEDFSLTQKLEILRDWFQREFRYSKELTISMSAFVKASPTAVEQFLTQTRSGHCEYFATATVLLLREAGIPARFATGFAVMERDHILKEYMIRGTHAHAWCRVWDANARRWIDFDTTPTGWGPTSAAPLSWFQRFSDRLTRLREDFTLWQNLPENRTSVTVVIWLTTLTLVAYLVRKLWKSKRLLSSNKSVQRIVGPVISTPLHALEALAAKRLGRRPLGTPFAEWLDQLRPTLATAELLDEALALHQRQRFDPSPAPPSEQARLAVLAKELAVAVKQASPTAPPR